MNKEVISATKIGMATVLAMMLTEAKTKREMIELSGLSSHTIRHWINALSRPAHKAIYVAEYVTVYKTVNNKKLVCGLMPAYKIGNCKDAPKPTKIQ